MDVRDHGGGLDAAIVRYGGTRAQWIDLSTGINRRPYPVGALNAECWTALPDEAAMQHLLSAARHFWSVPDGAAVLAAGGASALIAALPSALGPVGSVAIRRPTYNEWEAAFTGGGWTLADDPDAATASVFVHPNNPDGALSPSAPSSKWVIYDESFADCLPPEQSRTFDLNNSQTLVLKSFGKFWGLAGVRLGFLMGSETVLAKVAERLGPWAVSGPALSIGATALEDVAWAEATRAQLSEDAARLDQMMAPFCDHPKGTCLFRLYTIENANEFQSRLAKHYIWSRIFPYSSTWLRLGLPGSEEEWERLEMALA